MCSICDNPEHTEEECEFYDDLFEDEEPAGPTCENIEALLFEFLNRYDEWADLEDQNITDGDMTVTTYESAMMLTSDRGLVIQLRTGEQFQVSIVQSRLRH